MVRRSILCFFFVVVLLGRGYASPLSEIVSCWTRKLQETRRKKPAFVVVPRTNNLSGGATEEKDTTDRPPPLPAALNLTIHNDLLTQHECETLLDMARPYLQASKVGRPPKVEPTLRISLSCKLPRLPIPELWAVEQKLAAAAGVPVERGEDLQVGGYPPSNYYGMHCDERPGGRPNGGGRLATALAYLNDLDPNLVTGGHTVFSGKAFDLQGKPDFPRGDGRVVELKRLCDCNDKTATRVAPAMGRVITFRNLKPCLDGTGDLAGGAWRFIPESTHGACPVVAVDQDSTTRGKGDTKYVVQQWFGLESEVNVARHPRLICHLGLGVANSYKISPMADLASPDGHPMATVSKEDFATAVDSLIPNIGATRLQGWCAQVDAQGQDPGELESNGVAAGMWIKLNNNGPAQKQRLFRVGPHQVLVGSNGAIVWAVGDRNTTVAANIRSNQWYHIAVTFRPPIQKNGAVAYKGELYLSIPGQAPRSAVSMEIEKCPQEPEWIDGVSIGGCRKGQECNVDLTVTDFYAVSADMMGKGHSLAFAVSYYDPGQGF